MRSRMRAAVVVPDHQEDALSRSEDAQVCMVWAKDCLKQRIRIVISICAVAGMD